MTDRHDGRPDPVKYRQVSFRITPELISAIKRIALAKGISTSEVMRAALAHYRHTLDLKPGIVLATVNTNDSVQSGQSVYFKVEEWLITD